MNFFITGGTGSWGRAMARHLLIKGIGDKITIYSRGEHAQESMARDFAQIDPEKRLRFRVGDVRDAERLTQAMRGSQYVFHAAALKIVPTCEADPTEAVKTNIVGTMNVVNAALTWGLAYPQGGVKKVVALSTDKAAASSTLYGSTKHCAERLVVASNVYSAGSQPRFSCVRYGNVEKSRGSVMPLFEKLVFDGSPYLPITDPRMTRFFFSIESAVEFTLSSMDMMAGGEVFIPKIKSKRIVDLAREIAPGMPHKIIGIRGGEKLHETLISEDESRMALELSDRYVIQPADPCWSADHLHGAKPVPDGFRYTSETALIPALQAAE